MAPGNWDSSGKMRHLGAAGLPSLSAFDTASQLEGFHGPAAQATRLEFLCYSLFSLSGTFFIFRELCYSFSDHVRAKEPSVRQQPRPALLQHMPKVHPGPQLPQGPATGQHAESLAGHHLKLGPSRKAKKPVPVCSQVSRP